MSEFNPGDVLRVSTYPPFADPDGVATDPTTITLRWRYYLDTEWTEWVYGTDAEVIRAGTGDFYADIPLTRSERLYYQWIGTGTVAAAAGSSILIQPLPGTSA